MGAPSAGAPRAFKDKWSPDNYFRHGLLSESSKHLDISVFERHRLAGRISTLCGQRAKDP
jgi:hypothetical protein